MFDADPIWVGGVYIESDQGSDLHGDNFYITFTGGADDTQLTKLIIDLDQNAPGYGVADNIFDIVETGMGADHAYDFNVEQIQARDPRARVTARVVDGGMKLELNFQHFYAGDRLTFTIDVDEIQQFDPNERVQEEINLGIDPITSGVEFQGSKFQAYFQAPHFYDIDGQSIFKNRYDSVVDPSGLDLPRDDDDGLRDRSTGTAFTVTQRPKPISLTGTVYVDNNLNLVQDGSDAGLSGVQLELFRKQGSTFVSTGHRTTTDSQGNYRFGTELNLTPGTYQIREAQPAGYFSVGAVPGLLDGATVGETVDDNKDVLTEIEIPNGDQHATDLDFAEAQPASIRGYVYEDLDDDGRRDTGEKGIRDVEVRLEAVDTIGNTTTLITRTLSDGSYRFDNLPPGIYNIIEVLQPAGYFDGQDTPGTVGGTTRGDAFINDSIIEIVLNGNDVGVEFNFGELPPSSLSGHVCVAAPGFDCFSNVPGETEPLPGVKLELVDEDGNVVATTYSASGGSYRFDNLPSGTYTVIETTPEDLLDGHSRVGSIDGRKVGSDDDSNTISQIILGAGQNGINYDFCELRPGSISGHVFEDRNNDGVRGSNEPFIAGVTVTLYDGDGIEVGSVQTDSNGFYRFARLLPGNYTLIEDQPDGYVDGKDIIGTIRGVPVGIVDSEADMMTEIILLSGLDGINYDFGEIRTASIAGRVIVDSNGNCIIDAELDQPLPGVIIELRNASGIVIDTTVTDDDGRYRFEDLAPGTYSIREIQPEGLLQGDATIGNGGGREDGPDNLIAIPIQSGDELIEYNFCEIPPAVISGYVFQDGPALITNDGNPPSPIRPGRDGVRDASDKPIGGVLLELRLVTGEAVPSSGVLPGIYDGPVLTVMTDADGYFEFRGLPPGTYHIYQRHPIGFFDGIDTQGTTGGIAANVEDVAGNAELKALINSLKANGYDPGTDAVLRVHVEAGQVSQENNFSELRITKQEQPPDEPTPPIVPPRPPYNPPPVNGFPSLPFDRALPAAPPAPYAPPLLIGGGGAGDYAWHLSIINAGTPRGSLAGRRLTKAQIADIAFIIDVANWTLPSQGSSQWAFVSKDSSQPRSLRRQAFDVDGATPLAGDFNGDGQDEIALFLEGEWLIDVNGNGRWDRSDMWAKLGDKDDLPVIGDWDADGKDDIGIYGPEWEGDERALEYEPGLPDPQNRLVSKPKNVPPRPVDSPERERIMQRSIDGPARADVIDHVFKFGARDDQPVAGDFNGDGVATVGIFRAGQWRLDTNGDGRFTSDVDKKFDFGQAGDIAVVGDFDGDGIDEVAVIRGSKMFVDSNRNEKLDANDRVFELEGSSEDIVVGDFDGDGKDEPAVVERGRRVLNSEILREALKAG
jgi:protocatechuate 3,4-dioxygenase beta subunit